MESYKQQAYSRNSQKLTAANHRHIVGIPRNWKATNNRHSIDSGSQEIINDSGMCTDPHTGVIYVQYKFKYVVMQLN